MTFEEEDLESKGDVSFEEEDLENEVNMSFESLEDEIKDLRKEYIKEKKSIEELGKEYPNVKKEKPLLFDMICSPECDDDILKEILKTMKSFAVGEISQNKASEIFGGLLVDKYVKPVIPSPP
jgi:predicted RNase H-like nuclease (RuvC/YqgF family)